MVLLESKNVPLGSEAYPFELSATDGKTYSMEGFKDAQVLVVVFMCNHCPYVQAVWDRMVKLQADFMDKGVRFVGINPNFHPDYPEETMEKMKDYYLKYSMNFPYLLDESQEVARKYGAECTPDIFVYNLERKLVYHGRIDDNWQDEASVTKEELREVLDTLVAGDVPSEEGQHPSIGCSIKWREE